MKDLISVIVPVYKVEKYLNRCVDSILSQTYTNLEVILVDDGSPDSCPAICDEYAGKDRRVKVIHKANGGVSSARNSGLDVAKGDFVSFIDSDDWVDHTMYEKLLTKQKDNNADIVLCRYNEVHDDRVVRINELELSNVGADGILPFVCADRIITNDNEIIRTKCIVPSVCRMIVKKSIFDGIRFDCNILIAEDKLVMIQLFQKARTFNYVDEYLHNYAILPGSTMHGFNEKLIQHACNFGNKVKEYVDSVDYVNAMLFNEYAFYYWLTIIYNKPLNNKEIFKWNTHKNYKAMKKFRFNVKFISKFRVFLIRLRCRWLLRLLYLIKYGKR